MLLMLPSIWNIMSPGIEKKTNTIMPIKKTTKERFGVFALITPIRTANIKNIPNAVNNEVISIKIKYNKILGIVIILFSR